MQDKPTRPNGEAERLVAHPLLAELFDALERDAIETAVHARSDDDLKRMTAMAEVRAIRAVRAKLKTLARGPAPASAGAAVV